MQVANRNAQLVTTACMTKPLQQQPGRRRVVWYCGYKPRKGSTNVASSSSSRRDLLIRPCRLLYIAEHAAGNDEHRSSSALAA